MIPPPEPTLRASLLVPLAVVLFPLVLLGALALGARESREATP